MRTKRKAAMLVQQRLARDRTEAYYDARALAIELVHGVPSARFDPMAAGVVMQQGETAYRQVPIWIRVQQDGLWAGASMAEVLVTDLRLLCRFGSGSLVSLWWSGLVGLCVDLAAENIVLDFGNGEPVNLAGVHVAPLAVLGIASVYGMESMLAHPALASLRTGPGHSQPQEVPHTGSH